jgi:hypothetical protein
MFFAKAAVCGSCGSSYCGYTVLKFFIEVCYKSSEKIDRQVRQSKENMATFDFVFMCMIFIEKCEINYASKTTEEGQ